MRTWLDRCSVKWMALAFVATAAGLCDGQTTQRIQLPTFRSFSVGTTVLVPDRGTAYLGGINGLRQGQSSFGFGNRGFSSSSNAGGVSVRTSIIDHHELDRALLAEAARNGGEKFDVYGRPVATASRFVPATTRSHRYQTGSSKYLRLARSAEADGDLEAAKVLYELAAGR
ncbi:MAG: hypothetical protein ACR2NU_07910 [Aeoliella sp.]